jgi:hypothetical protein
VPFDRGDRCGENGPNLNVAMQVWSEIRAMEMIVKNIEKNNKTQCMCIKGVLVCQRVAVAGWQWYHSMYKIDAVRMVPLSK